MAKVNSTDNIAGFTLVELVVVIVLLGVLAATALPRFVEVAPEARVAALETLQANLRSAASLANAQCRFSDGCYESGWASADILDLDGVAGRFYNGYPTANASSFASHITQWVEMTGFQVDTSNNLFTDFRLQESGPTDECKLRYHYADPFGEAPEIELTIADC